MNKFSQRLKELRKENKLTQKQLAEKLNVTDDCIYYWENNRSEPSIDYLISLANIFNVSIDYLVGKTEF